MAVAFLAMFLGLAAIAPALFIPSISSLEMIFIYLIVSTATILMQAALLAWPGKAFALRGR